MIEKIISGGQTGVDQAALFAASVHGIPLGGACQLGGLDEQKIDIRKHFPLIAIEYVSFEESVVKRTKENIKNSDGTLIILPKISSLKNIPDGTQLTISYAEKRKKPYLLIDLTEKMEASAKIKKWLMENEIRILNIAGPRESSCRGIYEQSRIFLDLFFQEVLLDKKNSRRVIKN